MIGRFALVLHSHLPWLKGHGRWPVGEEWLYQSWSAAYLPLIRVLRTLAAEDRAGAQRRREQRPGLPAVDRAELGQADRRHGSARGIDVHACVEQE